MKSFREKSGGKKANDEQQTTNDALSGRNIRLLGGITNLTDRKYYSRVFQNGIEPAQRRKFYAGLALGV